MKNKTTQLIEYQLFITIFNLLEPLTVSFKAERSIKNKHADLVLPYYKIINGSND